MTSMPRNVSGAGLLEDRHPHARVLVRARRAVGVGRAAVPRRRRVRVVVGDLALADHEVVREHAAHGLVEAAADRLVGDVEVLEHLRLAGADLLERLVDEVHRHARRVGDEVDPRAVALDRVGPLRDLPLERLLGRVRRLRQVDQHARAGRLHVRRLDLVRQRGRPQARERAAAGVEREVVAGALVVPARAHHPRVVAAVEVALLRLAGSSSGSTGGAGRPGCRAGRAATNVSSLDPVAVVGAAEQDPDAEVDVDEVGRHELAVDDDARGDEHLVAPVVHVLVVVVDVVGVVERAPAAEQDPPPPDLLVARAAPRRRSRTRRRSSRRPS